tara:strand:- start:7418 stop:7882 length:465 start_codon:yes stop_codon:yes gene_type:complete
MPRTRNNRSRTNRSRTNRRTVRRTNRRMRGGSAMNSMAPATLAKVPHGDSPFKSLPRAFSNGNGFGPKSYDKALGLANLRPLRGPESGSLKGALGKQFYETSLVRGGRRSRGLNRKSAKKVKRCLKKAAGKKSAKARRSATKKCMKLKKSLRKH